MAAAAVGACGLVGGAAGYFLAARPGIASAAFAALAVWLVPGWAADLALWAEGRDAP